MSTAMIYRLIDRGELADVRVSNAIRISLVELTVYIESKPLMPTGEK